MEDSPHLPTRHTLSRGVYNMGLVHRLRCSNIGSCPRRLGALEMGLYSIGESNEGAMKPAPLRDGHWHEYDVKTRLADDNVDFENGLSTTSILVEFKLNDHLSVFGHPDGIIQARPQSTMVPRGRWLLEVKSMNTGSFWQLLKLGYREAFPAYFDQLQAYLNSSIVAIEDMSQDNPVRQLYGSLGIPEVQLSGSMPDMAIVLAKNKDSGVIRAIPIERDEGYADGLRRRWLTAIDETEALVLPQRLHESQDNYECRRCPFREQCWGEIVEVVPVIPTAEQENAALLYRVGKGLSQFGESLMADSRAAIEPPDEPCTLRIGKVKIRKYARKSTSWNATFLEAVLTPDQLDKARAVKHGFATVFDIDPIEPAELRSALRIMASYPENRMLIQSEKKEESV